MTHTPSPARANTGKQAAGSHIARIEWPTLAVTCATYAALGLGGALWGDFPVLSVVIIGVALAQFSSLQHEVLHGHPFARQWLNEALVFPALMVVVPYLRFKDTHLAHHHDQHLTDPYDDPESNYLDPSAWARMPRWLQKILMLNNTLAGRMLFGPVIGICYFLLSEAKLLANGHRRAWAGWGLNALGLAPLIWWLGQTGMALWAYGLAVYIGLALLRIRTFLDHRAHTAHRSRTVDIEDRGPLALLFLNNNYHVVHHMHPNVAWYDLPALYAQRKDHFLRRNEGYVYSSYRDIFKRYFLSAKDPVAHPIWPVRKEADIDEQAAITNEKMRA
jgi:fatty acid desaturase